VQSRRAALKARRRRRASTASMEASNRNCAKQIKSSLRSFVRSLTQSVRGDSLLRNTAYLMGTGVATAGLGYLFWIVAAHTYSTYDVGLGSALISAMSLASTLATVGIGSTLVQTLPRRETGHAWSVTLNAGLATSILAGVLTGLIMVAVLPIFSNQFAMVDHTAGYAFALIAGVPLMTVSAVLDQAFVAERAANHMLVRNAAMAILKIPLLVLPVVLLPRLGALGILLSGVVAMAVVLIGGLLLLIPRLGRGYCLAVRGMVGQVRSMLSSLALHHFINIGGALSQYLLPVFVALRLSPTDNAYFYTTGKLGAFFFMVSSAVALSLFAEGSHARDDLRRKVRSSAVISSVLLCPAMLVCFFGGRYILLVFGPSYAQHGVLLLRIYVVAAVPDAITNLYVSVLRVQRRLGFAVLLQLGMAGLTWIVAWILLPVLGIAAVGWAFLIAQTTGSLVTGADLVRMRLRQRRSRGLALQGVELADFGEQGKGARAAQMRPRGGGVASMTEKRPLRICVVGAGMYFLSGISYYTLRLANALTCHHRVSLIAMRRLLPARLYPGWKRVGAPLTRLYYDSAVRVVDGVDWYWLPSIFRALALLKRERPDVVLFQWWSGTVLHSYLLLALVARLLGTRVVIEFHEVLDPGEAVLPLVQTYVRWIAPLTIRRAHAFVVHSEYERQLLQQHYDIEGRPIVLIPHGPYDQYRNRTDSPQRGNRIAPGSCCNLLFFGLIRPYKGLEDLVTAFDALPENEIAQYWLTVVGETWEGWTEPARLINQSRYRDRITFVNRYVSDAEVAEFFAGADAVVLPYHRASASGPLHIALSHGLPVVATRVGGVPEAVAQYDGAILVPPGDPIALQHALRQAALLRGRRYVDAHSWEHTAACYRALFEIELTPAHVEPAEGKLRRYRTRHQSDPALVTWPDTTPHRDWMERSASGGAMEQSFEAGFTVWLTGLSGAGKSTIARRLERELRDCGREVEVLDGDVVRTHLSKGLGFSREDRDTNIGRIAFVGSLLARHHVAVIAAAISPYAAARRQAREQIGNFLEVYVHCSMEELIRRDVKGLYEKALRGELPNFTGVSDPYEEPEQPDVIVETDRETVDESVVKILAALRARGYLKVTEEALTRSSPRAEGH
jgi:adenylyl-sulfate kinase